jgi:hypothetical protein
LQVFGEKTTIQTANEFVEIKTIDTKTTKLQRNQSHGGQSKNRIERLRQESIHNYLKLAGEKAMNAFVKEGVPIIKALLIVGPGMKKEQITEYINIDVPTMVKSADLNTPIMPFIFELISNTSSTEYSKQLKEIDMLLSKSADMLAFGDDLKSDNIKIIYDNPLVIQKYGGPVGIRYYPELCCGLDLSIDNIYADDEEDINCVEKAENVDVQQNNDNKNNHTDLDIFM